MFSKTKITAAYLITALLLLVLFVYSVNTGSLKVTPVQLFKGLFVAYDKDVATIYDLRFPRIFIAMLGGAAMAVSGVLLQAVMKNPLADPGIIGVSSGASFVAVLVTACFPLLYKFTPLFACVGGCTACALVYLLSWKSGLSPIRLILVGVAINSMFTGLMSAFNSSTGSTYSGVASIVNANITQKTWDDFRLLVCYAVVGLLLSLFVTRYIINTVGNDDDPAWTSPEDVCHEQRRYPTGLPMQNLSQARHKGLYFSSYPCGKT